MPVESISRMARSSSKLVPIGALPGPQMNSRRASLVSPGCRMNLASKLLPMISPMPRAPLVCGTTKRLPWSSIAMPESRTYPSVSGLLLLLWKRTVAVRTLTLFCLLVRRFVTVATKVRVSTQAVSAAQICAARASVNRKPNAATIT